MKMIINVPMVCNLVGRSHLMSARMNAFANRRHPSASLFSTSYLSAL